MDHLGNINIDEAISRFCSVFAAIDIYDSKAGFSEMMAKAIVNTKTADERYKARQLAKIMGTINDQIETLRYLNKPVRQEGILQSRSDRTVQLKNITLESGAQIEYLMDDEWNFGVLRYDENIGKFIIINANNGKAEIKNLDGIHARVR